MAIDQLEATETVQEGEAGSAVPALPRAEKGSDHLQAKRQPLINPSAEELLVMVQQVVPIALYRDGVIILGTTRVLDWLLTFPGNTWQERWEASGADAGAGWIQDLVDADPRRASTARNDLTSAIYRILLCRVVYPSYDFLTEYVARTLFGKVQERVTPDLFTQLNNAATELKLHPGQSIDGMRVIIKIVLHAGKGVDEITAHDLLDYRDWCNGWKHKSERGVSAAWDMLRKIGVIEDVDFRVGLRRGQETNQEIIDRYGIKTPEIRTLLTRYLDERRPGMDYVSLRSIAFILADLFWATSNGTTPSRKISSSQERSPRPGASASGPGKTNPASYAGT
ncbi:hypothetical protein AB0H37_00160 [Actinomadura sp. NPDC023710]|uniref:hypothetical protein n=1 Tax=Actinomadura sp. NPDC023710 TaxID=3158219 RepID=UPI0033D6A7DF